MEKGMYRRYLYSYREERKGEGIEGVGPPVAVPQRRPHHLRDTPEIAPRLREHGALGGKNAHVASMETLAIVAARYPRFVRNNPLVENRIWLNCFDGKDLPLLKILLGFSMTFGRGDGNEAVRNASRNAVS